VRKRIATPHGRLRANYVVLCGNLQISGLMPQIAETLLPMTTYVVTTEKLGSVLGKAIRYSGAISDSDLVDSHYRVVDGDRLLWSGRATAWTGAPRRYARALRAEIRKTYPQLGKVALDHAWSGTVGIPLHRMPQIGELGPGLWLASGFGGHGLNTTAMAGNLVARAIAHDDPAWKLFSPYELVWAGGKYGRAIAQVYYWTRRLAEAVAERRAHFGEFGARRGMLQTAAAEDDRDAVDPTSLPETDGEPNLPPRAEGDSFGSDSVPSAAEFDDMHMDAPTAATDPSTEPAEDDRSQRD
jgi:gamma-glutamylputrescine oxidase